ncbi:hypothetical protein ABZT08_08430 [Streptomyces sp. NPDC005526]|uniref:hypothetical protein n=1 Tax=Streptomyces sp. NPDC005526 TaxID=3156885 RepID=UPI0033A3A4E2
MFRGTAARTAFALLSAVLLALPVFASIPSFASAHTVRHTEAKTPTGITPSGAAAHHETATPRDCGPAGNPTGPLRTRDRQRVADSAPEAPERPALKDGPAAAHEAAGPGAAHPRASRPPADRTPAALQVFRC